jgi:predicted ribosomally synthesized peptide with SipW-like signal peptide
MTHEPYSLSRRSVLAGLGTIGIASAGAGLGTTAFFSDEESVSASLEAGRLDLKLDYRATYVPGNRATPFDSVGVIPDTDMDGDGNDDRYLLDQVPDLRYDSGDLAGRPLSEQDWGDAVKPLGCDDASFVDGEEGVMFTLDDVKPKDEGEFTISLHHCDNPAYLWLRGEATAEDENVAYEPEITAGDDESDVGELADYLYVEAFYDTDCDNRKDPDRAVDIALAIDVSGSMLYPQHGGLVADPDDDTPRRTRPDELRTSTADARYTDDTYKIDLVEDAASDFAGRVFATTLDAQIGVTFFGTTDGDGDFVPGDSSASRPAVRSSALSDDASAVDTTLADLRYEVAGPGRVGTDLPVGIETAQSLLDAGRPDAEKVMIVLGDGGQDGTSGAVGEANAAKAAGTRVVTIAFGANAKEGLLRNLASDPKEENFYDVRADLDALEAAVADAFTSIVLDLVGDVRFFRGSLSAFLAVVGAGVPFDPLGVLDPETDGPVCVEPSTNCIALDWYLPCFPEEFATLLSDADVADADEDGAISLADELAAKGLPFESEDAINVVQTDSVAFRMVFAAVQCRHNTDNANPFAPVARAE